jgi:hypothetical protein
MSDEDYRPSREMIARCYQADHEWSSLSSKLMQIQLSTIILHYNEEYAPDELINAPKDVEQCITDIYCTSHMAMQCIPQRTYQDYMQYPDNVRLIYINTCIRIDNEAIPLVQKELNKEILDKYGFKDFYPNLLKSLKEFSNELNTAARSIDSSLLNNNKIFPH